MTCPFPILYFSSRRWLYLSLGRIVLSYFFPVEFRDFFIADELNSLSYSFWTFSYFVCAYNFHWNDLQSNCPVKIFWYTPFLASLPPWWRLLQCIRRYNDSKEKVHLSNGLKYCTSIAATLATGYRRMHPHSIAMEMTWVLCSLVNSTYTSFWDVKMDWGLLQPHSSHFLLRDELVFYRWAYYVAAPINVLLRFAWSLNSAGFGFKGERIGFLTALLEAYRRIQWNFFRLENEHLNNVGNYRAIKEIPLPFALQDTSKQLQQQQQQQQQEVDLEEGRIQLPVEVSPAATLTPGQPHPLSESTPVGSFYGCRDYENRHDFDDAPSAAEHVSGLGRQPSMMDIVLDRMKTKTTDSSDSEDDDDDENENETVHE
ncbi:EXS family-domain-containing protein [Mycotypha africana]|uniref:EXS family-domain-containing protein n=1 Tax=Mycotypha africana TaxID=64632 RepID=UPI0022FFE783|nr:EXS family-domain-containing protein [Mycotypha africana]KAI8982260.1 EXS family-domain-containing protein [Mycotypha africana]